MPDFTYRDDQPLTITALRAVLIDEVGWAESDWSSLAGTDGTKAAGAVTVDGVVAAEDFVKFTVTNGDDYTLTGVTDFTSAATLGAVINVTDGLKHIVLAEVDGDVVNLTARFTGIAYNDATLTLSEAGDNIDITTPMAGGVNGTASPDHMFVSTGGATTGYLYFMSISGLVERVETIEGDDLLDTTPGTTEVTDGILGIICIPTGDVTTANGWDSDLGPCTHEDFTGAWLAPNAEGTMVYTAVEEVSSTQCIFTASDENCAIVVQRANAASAVDVLYAGLYFPYSGETIDDYPIVSAAGHANSAQALTLATAQNLATGGGAPQAYDAFHTIGFNFIRMNADGSMRDASYSSSGVFSQLEGIFYPEITLPFSHATSDNAEALMMMHSRSGVLLPDVMGFYGLYRVSDGMVAGSEITVDSDAYLVIPALGLATRHPARLALALGVDLDI